MPRAHLYRPIQDTQGNLRLQATVRVFDDASTDLTSEPLFTSEVGTSTVPHVFTTNTGIIDFYTDTPKRFRIGVRVGDEPEVLFDGVDTLDPSSSAASTLGGHPASFFYSPDNPPPGGTVTLLQPTSSNTTLTDNDSVVFVDQPDAMVALPSAVGRSGHEYTIKNLNATNLTVTSGGGTIDGDTQRVLAQYDALTVISNGTFWGVV